MKIGSFFFAFYFISDENRGKWRDQNKSLHFLNKRLSCVLILQYLLKKLTLWGIYCI